MNSYKMKMRVCEVCRGKGMIGARLYNMTCPTCGGTGKIERVGKDSWRES